MTSSTYCSDFKQNNGSKIIAELENPFSNVFVDIATPMLRPLHQIGATPNDVTFVGFILGFAAVLCVAKCKPHWAAVLYFLTYLTDTIDGKLARLYDQCTEFGSYAEHGRDILIFVLIILYASYYHVTPQWMYWVFGALTVGTIVHFGLVQELHDKYCGVDVKGEFLNMCIGPSRLVRKVFGIKTDTAEEHVATMRWTRYVSDGSIILCIVAYLLYCYFSSSVCRRCR